ncbi:MAG TPA: sugar phosphate nucleotidyltransferase [Candidatus Dormibacteraeota bacterium]|nr:sugar phosphate nucleotidyltransferase [Candidatus Dormibacteraeota bacterium]
MLPCVVLAGGLGTRMRPATDSLPKSLLPVLGRPFAELQLEWLARAGVERVIYSIGFEGGQVRDVVGTGDRFGVRVDYVDEGDDLRGSGGALRLALDAGVLPPRFFVLNGDSYLSVPFTDVERTWHASGLPAIMTVMRNNNRWDSSNATFTDGRVFYDKRASAEARAAMEWIDYGLSATSSDVIAGWLRPGDHADLADLFHQLSVDGRLAGYEVADRFYEIGSPTGLRELEDHLREGVR